MFDENLEAQLLATRITNRCNGDRILKTIYTFLRRNKCGPLLGTIIDRSKYFADREAVRRSLRLMVNDGIIVGSVYGKTVRYTPTEKGIARLWTFVTPEED